MQSLKQDMKQDEPIDMPGHDAEWGLVLFKEVQKIGENVSNITFKHENLKESGKVHYR